MSVVLRASICVLWSTSAHKGKTTANVRGGVSVCWGFQLVGLVFVSFQWTMSFRWVCVTATAQVLFRAIFSSFLAGSWEWKVGGAVWTNFGPFLAVTASFL